MRRAERERRFSAENGGKHFERSDLQRVLRGGEGRSLTAQANFLQAVRHPLELRRDQEIWARDALNYPD